MAIVLAGVLAVRVPAFRPVTDVWVGVTVAGNAALVGAAIGANGMTAVVWLPHLPLEWAALANVTAGYLHGRRTAAPARTLARRAGVATVLLAMASLVETLATPQGS
jgi:hypothetical protein